MSFKGNRIIFILGVVILIIIAFRTSSIKEKIQSIFSPNGYSQSEGEGLSISGQTRMDGCKIPDPTYMGEVIPLGSSCLSGEQDHMCTAGRCASNQNEWCLKDEICDGMLCRKRVAGDSCVGGHGKPDCPTGLRCAHCRCTV